MQANELADKALNLAGDSAGKLERWLLLFEAVLSDAEEGGRLCELKDFAVFLAALERALKIAKLAATLTPENADATGPRLDKDALRELLSEED